MDKYNLSPPDVKGFVRLLTHIRLCGLLACLKRKKSLASTLVGSYVLDEPVRKNTVAFRDIFQIPNLVSLSRVFLTPVVAYFLWKDDNQSNVICIVLLVIAAVSDFLDGFLARRMGRVGPLGIALDPIADKIFAGALVLMLIFTRDFPVWMAAAIIGRDIVILGAGAILLRGRDLVLPSNLTGKYAFSAIAVLMASYVVRFPFGITLFTWLTVIFLVASLIGYARVFCVIKSGGVVAPFRDTPVCRALRIAITLTVSVIYLYRFYLYFFA